MSWNWLHRGMTPYSASRSLRYPSNPRTIRSAPQNTGWQPYCINRRGCSNRSLLVGRLKQHGGDVKKLQEAGFYTVESVVYVPKRS